MAALEPFVVQSAQGPYPVEFDVPLGRVGEQLAAMGRLLFVVDHNVAALHAAELSSLLARGPHRLIVANEEEKTWDGVGRLLQWLHEQRCDKRTLVVGVGGGIVQDLVTFATHVFHRGVRWALLPTTVLSMCDSCIGAKCGINLGAHKNQLGVFHSPAHVTINTSFVSTLSDADVRSGYGEILKLMLTGPADGLDRLERALDASGFRGPELPALIRESLLVKKQIIEEDEYELGRRVVLNYGHTFGHALEAATKHEVPHGLAVAWGIDLVNSLAAKRGVLAAETHERIHRLIAKHFAIPKPAVEAGALVSAAARDKKAAAGEVRLILLEKPGTLRVQRTPIDDALQNDVAGYLRDEDPFPRH